MREWPMIVAVMIVGCATAVQSEPAPVPLEQFCGRIADAVCEGNAECCSGSSAAFPSRDACRPIAERDCRRGVSGAPAFAHGDNEEHPWPDLAFNETAAGAVVAQFELAARRCASRATFQSFMALFSPQKMTGDACTADYQCVIGLACRPLNRELNATSACAALGVEDEPCDLDAHCNQPLQCVRGDDVTLRGACETGRAMDATCGGGIGQCVPELACRVSENSSEPARCQQPLALGTACDPAAYPCGAENTCRSDITGVVRCTARRALSEACESASDCSSGVCLVATESSARTCAACNDDTCPASDGECVEGACRYLRRLWTWERSIESSADVADGGECVFDFQCGSGTCVDLRCADTALSLLYCPSPASCVSPMSTCFR